MKTWSYEELTDATESYIKQQVQRSRESEREHLKDAYMDSAFGAYMLWSEITAGWKKTEDDERFESLTR